MMSRSGRTPSGGHLARWGSATSWDALPGGADTVGSSDNLAVLAALIARESRERRDEQNTGSAGWRPSVDGATDATTAGGATIGSTKLATGLGHRMTLLVVIHLVYAFIACCACAAEVAPRRSVKMTTKVLMAVEATFASSLGIFCFFVFGLTRNQVLWKAISRCRTRCRDVGRQQRSARETAAMSAARSRADGVNMLFSPSSSGTALTAAAPGPRRPRSASRDLQRETYRINSVDVNEM